MKKHLCFLKIQKKNKEVLLKLLGLKKHKLSKREKEVLPLCLEGSSFSQMAKKLFISHRTVEKHVDSLKYKFDCCTKYELVKKLQSYRDVIDLFFLARY